MGLGQRPEAFAPRRGELKTDDAMVLGVADPLTNLAATARSTSPTALWWRRSM